MPRIRKKTSKRGTTAQRGRIKHKVREGRKKSKKAAKRDLTWKSKKAKDPGIPNDFPYKDQILAEIAEERRQAAEAKARRKEEKKTTRAQQNVALKAGGNDGDDGSPGQDSDDAEGEEGGFDGVVTLAEPTKSSSKSTRGAPATASASASTTEASGAPQLLNPDLPHLAAVLDKADVVIEVLDARDPLSHRSHALEARVASKEGQKLLLVLNKIDACAREPTAAWAAHLRSEHPTLFFRVASSFLPPVATHDPKKRKGKSKEPSDDAWGLDAVSELLGHWAQEKTGDGPLHVAVVGLTNSGKSAFINSLALKSTLEVYVPSSSTNNPTTTPHALEVTLELNGVPIVFIDTPGLAWQPSEEASPEERGRFRARDVLLRNKGRVDRLKDPIPAVSCIVSRAETEDLMVFYGLPAFAKGDVDAFLMGIARARGLIKKRGNPDLAGAARIVLSDWSTGKLSRYAVPPSGGPGAAADSVSPALATIYAGDAALLERLLPRKELRRSHDLVRLSSERVDDRALAFDAPWFDADGVSSSDGEDESETEAVGSGTDGEEAAAVESAVSDGLDGSVSEEGDNDEGEDEDAEDEDEEEEVPLNPRSSLVRKRKRPPPPTSALKPQLDPTRPRKKVAFATSVKAITNSTRSSRVHTLSPSATRLPPKKSITKASRTTIPPPPRSRKSAANAPTTTTAQKRKAAGENDAYDFSKFF